MRAIGPRDPGSGSIADIWARRVRLLSEVLRDLLEEGKHERQPLPDRLDRVRGAPAAERYRIDHHREAIRIARTLGRIPLGRRSRCLRASILLSGMLARRGIPSALVIGVDPGPPFVAHSWVEYCGRAVLPDGGATFTRLVEL